MFSAVARSSLTKVAPRVGVRAQSTTAMSIKRDPKKNWLSDPSTYPLIAIMGAAGGLCFGFMAYKLAYCGDVRITSNAKGKILREWKSL